MLFDVKVLQEGGFQSDYAPKIASLGFIIPVSNFHQPWQGVVSCEKMVKLLGETVVLAQKY